jgi:hypothetical protein
MRGRALPLPFGHSWTVPKNRRVDLGLPSRFWTGMGISGAITLGVFFFFLLKLLHSWVCGSLLLLEIASFWDS